jgi:Tol biopolymer transport system component
VFVTGDGHVKILDFGLARQAGGVPAAGETTGGRTILNPTQPGTVMGTVGYMAPEQVRGEVCDHRADLFSLGCVLYEMASGRRAFMRETAAETMTAVLREEPPELAREPGAGGAVFDGVVRHCLEKRPEERFQSARDLAFALRSLSGSSASGPHAVPVAAAPARPRRVLIAGALVACVLAGFVAGRAATSRAGGTPPEVRSFAQVTDQPGVEATPALSPDGKSLVYSKTLDGDTDLYSLRIGSRTAVRLTADSPGEDREPAFSPDGERIAFRSERGGGGIFLMSASGESVTRLTDFGFSPSWSPDGAEIVVSNGAFTSPTGLFATTRGLVVVDVKSGKSRQLPIDARALQPAWSPSGARISYWSVRGSTGQRDIWTVSADGSDAAAGGIPVTEDSALDWSPTWSPDGRHLYFSSTRGGTMNLWRVAIDERSGRVLGEPEPVTTPSAWAGPLSFSRDGTRLAFASLDYRSTLLRVPFDATREAITGPPVPFLRGTRPIRDHELSPDGGWVAFTEAGAQEDLFVARVDGTQYRRLTDDPFRDRGPAWAPDGQGLAFYTDRSGEYELWTIRPDGSGLAQLTTGTGTPGFPVWSPDGGTIAFGFDRWHLVAARSASPISPPVEASVSATERFMPASWSPDAGRIAGQVRGSTGAIAGVFVYSRGTKRFDPVPGDLTRAPVWVFPVWLADGRRLIVRSPEGIVVVDADTGAGRPLVAVAGDMVGRSVGVSRDNRWITYTETATEGDIWIATLRPGQK